MHSDKIEEFLKKNKIAEQAGGQDKILAQHEKGSFVELDKLTTHHYHEYEMQKKKFFGDAIITGYGKINGRQVFVFAYDFTVLGGTLSQMGENKINKLLDHVLRVGFPF